MKKEFLEDYFEDRRAWVDVIEFYKDKIAEDTYGNSVWNFLLKNAETKLQELDIDIQFLERLIREDEKDA